MGSFSIWHWVIVLVRSLKNRLLTSKHAKKPRAKSACLCNGRGDRDRLMCYFLSFHPHD